MNFSLGQKVICIQDHSKGFVTKGNIYTVQGFACCYRCGMQTIDVGIRINPSGTRCNTCSPPNGPHMIISHGINVINVKLFRPLDSLDEQLEAIEVEGNHLEEPVFN